MKTCKETGLRLRCPQGTQSELLVEVKGSVKNTDKNFQFVALPTLLRFEADTS